MLREMNGKWPRGLLPFVRPRGSSSQVEPLLSNVENFCPSPRFVPVGFTFVAPEQRQNLRRVRDFCERIGRMPEKRHLLTPEGFPISSGKPLLISYNLPNVNQSSLVMPKIGLILSRSSPETLSETTCRHAAPNGNA